MLTALIFIVAVAYSAVGQAGASGYLAAMGLMGVDPALMKPVALALNLVVAGIGTVQFWRARQFSWRTFYPFGVLGFPFSFIGGALHLPAHTYYPIVGVLLLLAAILMFRSARRVAEYSDAFTTQPPFIAALVSGAVIGLVSGVTGTGGGIFLAPIILTFKWVELRRAAAVTAAYNLLNSAAALVGALTTATALPPTFPLWIAVAAIGGLVGSFFGSRILPDKALRYVLAGVLLVSGIKLLMG